MNVICTSAGRRTSLIRDFKTAIDSSGTVWAGDMDPLAPALQVAHSSIILPPVNAPEYIPRLLDHAREFDIDFVVPLIDTELRQLAEAHSDFASEGCEVVVSDSDLLDIAHDKWKTVKHFSSIGVGTPQSWLPNESSPHDWPDPVFVKPRHGSASSGACSVPREKSLSVIEKIESPIVQEVITAPEITIDALFGLEGTLIHYVPRLRIRTLAGESIQGRTLPDTDLGSWLRPILREVGTLGARGPITLQAFLTEPTPTLSEINARFGGGFPLTKAAGGHYPSWIMQMHNGHSIEPRLGEYTVDLCMTRAYTEWFIDMGAAKEDRK